MRTSRWYFHPVAILVFSILALVFSLFLYIYTFVEANTSLQAVIRTINVDQAQFTSYKTWVVITLLSILVGFILMNIVVFFVYNQKTYNLYRTQRNFINNFTHELKTPVTSLKLYLETFLAHELPREQQLQYIQYMLKDVERLSDNVTSILSLGRIESKNHAGEFEVRDMVELLREFLRQNTHVFENLAITFHEPARWPVLCRVKPALMEMVFMNLLTNAIKYNQSQAPTMDVAFHIKKRKLTMVFSDNGIGLDKKVRKKIFKKFYRTGPAVEHSAKGSGLGLYLVALVAKIHKGKVWAQSAGAGQGTEISLTLPLRKTGEKHVPQPG